MMRAYFDGQKNGRVNMRAQPRNERETPFSALVDDDGGLGHEPSRQAMEIAIAQARSVGVVSVRNSSLFSACGTRATACP